MKKRPFIALAMACVLLPAELPQKDASLIIYCRTGVRSKQASDKLVALGYTNIYDMGGIVDWTYETELPEE